MSLHTLSPADLFEAPQCGVYYGCGSLEADKAKKSARIALVIWLALLLILITVIYFPE